MKYVVGIDIGGTFTDLVCIDEAGKPTVIKTPSTPSDPSLAVIEGLKKLADHLNLDFKEFMESLVRICHGTTVSTNTVLTWTGAKVGLLCTKGFRDILGVRCGIRENPYDFTIAQPEPLSPRYLRIPIEERIIWNGDEKVSLNEDQVREACEFFKKEGVEAVAVCFLWSFKNPSHEKRAVEICREELPDVYVCGSFEIQPEVREYWRMSTTVLNAYVGPNLSKYIKHLVEFLREAGFKGELLITQSNAGVISPEVAINQAVRTILSGPACAPAAAAYVCAPLGLKDVITTDMGGTSFDVCLIKNGEPMMTFESAVGGVYHMRLPMIDIHTIGAGGGSIAHVDRFGVLHVGPQSAGADPGPACYGRGGDEPTVTDADLVLGYLNPEYFLGGEIPLRPDLAHKAIKEKVADPLGIGVTEAAWSIRKIADHMMTDAISVVSVQRGEDPRRYTIVAAGGAGPVHAASLAQFMGIKKILVPRESSIFCALGGVISDLKHDLVRSIITRVSSIDLDLINTTFKELKEIGDSYLDREGIPQEDRYYIKSMDMRYKGQYHELEIKLPDVDEVTDDVIKQVVEDFHKKHEQLYSYRDTTDIEIINLRLSACGKVVTPSQKPMPSGSSDVSRHKKAEREVFFEVDGELKGLNTPIYDGDSMEVGNVVEGPAIIEQKVTTIVVPPGAKIEVTPYGHFLMELS